MTVDLNHPLFAAADRYDQGALNAVISAYATNDDRLKDIVDALLLYYTTVAQPGGNQVQDAAQVQADIDDMYDVGDTAHRMTALAPGDPARFYQEVLNCLKQQPFSDLLDGASLDAGGWVKVLRIFTVLKGLLYYVNDGPSYEADPVFVKDGSFYYTTITNSVGDCLLVDSTGKPLLVNGAEVFLPLPGAPISLVMFWLKRMEVQKLRTLFRIGCFEAGIDAKYSNDAAYNFLDKAFVFDQTTPSVANQKTKRFPCGFTQAGAFRFLRDDVVAFTPVDSLSALIPASGLTGAGVEDRMVMDESYVQTPFGLIRIPRCLLSWGSLLSYNDRVSDVNGDPMAFIGLHLSVSLRETEAGQTTGEALPVNGNGFDDTTISPLEKNAEPVFPAQPFTGTQKQHMDVLSGYVYQHGTIIGFIQRDAAGPTSIPQFVQIQVNLVVQPLKAGTLATALAGLAQGTRDEVTKLEVISSTLDATPVRTMGLTPAIALAQVASGFAGYTLDTDQGILTKLATVVAGPIRTKTYEVVLPVALHLLKNSSPYTPSNLNGCAAAFSDAWAIRKVSSVQKHLGTIILDNGAGSPEVFPNDFIGADVTFLASTGPIKGTIDGKIGDKLARLPAGVVDKLVAGDIVVIDRRIPEASLDGTYRGEVSHQGLVDLRLRVVRLVEPVVEEASQFAPSPSPADPVQHALSREKPKSLVDAAVQDCYATMESATESKLRYDVSQKIFAKAANRHDRFDLRVGADDLKGFLIQFVNDYDRNKAHRYTVGENVIIHWPTKAARTPVSLGRYPVERVVDQQDEMAIEDVPGWGPVPVVTKLLRASSHTRYPIRFDKALTFTSDRSFVISGHTKLGGTFFLRPSETQIYEPVVHVTVYQNRLVNGVTKKTFLGSVDFDYRYANSFKNAAGIIRIDNDSHYDPTTQRLSIVYNQTVNFSTDEPGEVTFASTYHDLSIIHPLWHWHPDQYGLEVSHLADTTALQIKDGAIIPVDPALTMRLEGISNNGGEVTVRWNRDDAFKLIALGQNGLLKTKWVIRGLPFVIIDSVTYDSAGVATDVVYRALWVDRRQTITSQINSDARCRQTYSPCAMKYGWVDLTQSNIHTEAMPFTVGGRFGFYELRDFLDVAGALRYGDAAKTIFFMLERTPLDYRFTQVFDTSSSTGLTAIASIAILLNPKTKERRAVTGVFKTAQPTGSGVELTDELTLATMDPHTTLFIKGQDLTQDWVLDFAGMLVTVHDHSGAVYDHKLAVAGYWYGVHGLVDQAAMTRTVGDALLFSTDLITKVTGNWRIGDLPGRHLYRDNNLLFTERLRS